MYTWIWREFVSMIKSPKYLDQWFGDNFGELSGKFLLHCTAGPSSTRTGTWHHPELLHLPPAQRCEKNWDQYMHEPSSAERMQILRQGLGITKILLDLPIWSPSLGYSTIFFKSFALLKTDPQSSWLLGYFSSPLDPDIQHCSSLVPYMGALGMRPVLTLFWFQRTKIHAWWINWDFFCQYIACHSK